MEDVSGSLTGAGNVLRVLSLEEMDEELVRHFGTQAIEINIQR